MSGFSTLLIPPDLREDVLYGAAEIIEKEVITTRSSSPASASHQSTDASSGHPVGTTSVKQYHMHLFDEEERRERLQQLLEEEQQQQSQHTARGPPAPNGAGSRSSRMEDESRVALGRCRQLHDAYLRQLEWARGIVQSDPRLMQWLTCPADPTLWPRIEKMEDAIEAAAVLREMAGVPPDTSGATLLRQAARILRAEATHPGLYAITPVHVAGALVPYFTSSTPDAPPSPSPMSSSPSKTFTQGNSAGVNHGTTLYRLQPSSRVMSASDVVELPLTTKAMSCLLHLLTPPLVPPVLASMPLSSSSSSSSSSSASLFSVSSSSSPASSTPEALAARWGQLTRLHLSYFQAGATRRWMGSVQEVIGSWWAVAPRGGSGRTRQGWDDRRLASSRSHSSPFSRVSNEEVTEADVEASLAQRLQHLPQLPRRDGLPFSPHASTGKGLAITRQNTIDQEGRVRLQGGVYASVLSHTHAIVVFIRGAAEVLRGLEEEEEVAVVERSIPHFTGAAKREDGGATTTTTTTTTTGNTSPSSTVFARKSKRPAFFRRFITAPLVVHRVLPPSVQAELEQYLHMPVQEALAKGTLVLVGKPHTTPFSEDVHTLPRRGGLDPLPPAEDGGIEGNAMVPHETREEREGAYFSCSSSSSSGMVPGGSTNAFSPPSWTELEQVARQYLLCPVVLDRVGADHPLLVSAEKRSVVGSPPHPYHHPRPTTSTERDTPSGRRDDHLPHTMAVKRERDEEEMHTERCHEEHRQKRKREEEEEDEEQKKICKDNPHEDVGTVKKEPGDVADEALSSSLRPEQGKEEPKEEGRAWCQYQRLPLKEATFTSSTAPSSSSSSTSSSSSPLGTQVFFAYRFRMPFNRFLVFHGRNVEGGFQGRTPVLQKMKAEQEERLEAMAEEAWRDSLRRTASSGGGGGEERGGMGASIGNVEGLPFSSFASVSVPLTGAALRGAVEKAVMKVLATEPLSKADLLAHTELRPFAGSPSLEPVVKAVLKERAQYRGKKYELLE